MKTKKEYLKILLLFIFFTPSIGNCQLRFNSTKRLLRPSQAEEHWLPYINFNATKFKEPPHKFGPFVRWWWPGNDVTSNELKREIKLFANNGFAGVEIQVLGQGFPKNIPKSRARKIYSWDSKSYYKHVRAVMQQARESGITVDMTAGSGWPMSTPETTPESGVLELTYADTLISGGQIIDMSVPKNLYENKDRVLTMFSKKRDNSLARLQAVFAERIDKNKQGKTILDSQSAINITKNIAKNQRIKWKAPEKGNWKIFAYWSVPDMETNPHGAHKPTLFAINPLDSTKLYTAYNYLFGSRTGLEKYYGNPWRAIFNDSYEFRSQQYFSDHFFEKFEEKNGYDVRPWLPAILRPSKFKMTDQGIKRVRYDYNNTISNILIKQLIEGTNEWAEPREMLHRTQPYGRPKMNVLKASGHVDIPGAEQLYGGGSEGFIKLITSGAHLYNRPVITQESFVFWQRAFMTTPPKIKALVSKGLTAGVNQIIYHGSPYKYITKNFGKVGWYPFNSPYKPGGAFSSDINESNPFWKHIKDINAFISRSQYVLRSGNPVADVLIYDPEIGSRITPNPKETLVGGYFKSVEPKGKALIPRPREKYSKFWNVVNNLEASGITWDYVNDESLQQAQMKNGNIRIRGNSYKAIILPHIPYATLSAAQKINALSKQSANVLAIGSLPDKQPNFLHYKKNDQKIYHFLKQAVRQPDGHQLADAGLMNKWISKLPQEVQFNNHYSFMRQSVRKLQDGSLLNYLWNKSSQWQEVSLKATAEFNHFYWLNPDNGRITADNNRNKLNHDIPPYSSVILYAAKHAVSDSLLSNPMSSMQQGKEMARIRKWNITIGDTTVTNSLLFDWRSKETFKYKSSDGVYTGTFDLNKKKNKKYYLNMGKVYFTAQVFVNGQNAGKRIWSPYELNITGFLHEGKNKIKIRITPTMLNELIRLGKKANKGHKYYQFKDEEKKLMPAGLVGPVTIKSL